MRTLTKQWRRRTQEAPPCNRKRVIESVLIHKQKNSDDDDYEDDYGDADGSDDTDDDAYDAADADADRSDDNDNHNDIFESDT